MPDQVAVLEVRSLRKTFVTSRQRKKLTTHAVDDITLRVDAGDAIGVVGESGSGKTTLARMIMGLERPDSGEILFNGVPLTGRRASFPYGDIQVVFQDPQSSLDPQMTVRELLKEPLRGISKAKRAEYEALPALEELASRVGLRPEHLTRRSHQFSGGQRQRIAIARALVTRPSLMILDEPTSALDVSIQAQILNLLGSLQREYSLTYLFISHNLAVVRHLCNRVAVISHGRIVESGDTDTVFAEPQDAYTQKLLAAAPSLR